MSVVFNMDTSMGELVFDGLSVDSHPNPRRYEHFELFINVARRANGLALECTYNTDLFDAETIARRLAEFETFLAGIVADPHQRIAEVPLLSHEERERLLVTWNDTAVELPPSDFIHELFAAQAEHTPQAKAVKYGQQTINYHELNRRANQVAHYLQGLGVGPETIVGIYLDRSIDMVVGLLGVLKAGGAHIDT
jgi:non-ribosomal peptide synthetase component F